MPVPVDLQPLVYFLFIFIFFIFRFSWGSTLLGENVRRPLSVTGITISTYLLAAVEIVMPVTDTSRNTTRNSF